MSDWGLISSGILHVLHPSEFVLSREIIRAVSAAFRNRNKFLEPEIAESTTDSDVRLDSLIFATVVLIRDKRIIKLRGGNQNAYQKIIEMHYQSISISL